MEQYAVTSMGELSVRFHQLPNNTYTAIFGGNPANTVCVPAKYGMKTALIGSTGDDHLGRRWLTHLKQYGVDTSYIQVVPGSHTNITFEHQSEAKSLPLESVRISPVALTKETLPYELLENTSVLHIDGLSLIDETFQSAVWDAVSAARRSDALISFSVKYLPACWADEASAKRFLLQGIKEAELAILSQEELEFLGVSPMDLLHNYSSHCILIMMEQGCRYVCRDIEGYVQCAKSTEECKHGSCPDIFIGAFLYQYLQQTTPLKNLNQAELESMILFAMEKALHLSGDMGSVLSIPDL